MRKLSDKSKEILCLWKKEHNISEIAKLSGLSYDQIRNNYFKRFWKKGYFERISYGKYALNEKGLKRIELEKKIVDSRKIILNLSKKGKSNLEIKKFLKDNLRLDLTNSTIFSRVHLLKKEHKIKSRRIKEISVNENKFFYEFLGLILSDGYIGDYKVCFYNKDKDILLYYEKLIGSWGLNFSKRLKESGVYEVSVHSIKLTNLVNLFLSNKKVLSNQILEGKDIFKKMFLRGFYSGDGSVFISISFNKKKSKWRIEPRISLAVFNKPIMEDALFILNSLGYSPIVNGEHICLSKKKDIFKFFKEIRFIEGGKISHSRYFKNFAKNDLLKYIALNLEKDSFLKNEKDKSKIVSHICKELRNP